MKQSPPITAWSLIGPFVFLLAIATALWTLFSGYDGLVWGSNGLIKGVRSGGPGETAGLKVGDIILKVDDCTLPNLNDCKQWFYSPGEEIRVVFKREGSTSEAKVVLMYPPSRLLLAYLPILLMASVSCILSFLVWVNRPGGIDTKLFYAVGQTGAITLIMLILEGEIVLASRAYNLTFCLLSPILIHFHLVFPRLRWIAQRRGVLILLYLLGFSLGFIWPIHPIQNLWMSMGFLSAGVLIITAYVQSKSALERQRIRLVLYGTLLGFGPILFLTVLPAALFHMQWLPLKYTTIPLLAVPVSYGVALWRYRLMRVEHIFNRGFVLAVFTSLILGAYFAGLSLMAHVLPESIAGRSALGALIALFVALTFPYLRSFTQRMVDRVFYGVWIDYPHISKELGLEMSQAGDYDAIIDILTHRVPTMMGLPNAFLWLGKEKYLNPVGHFNPIASNELKWVENTPPEEIAFHAQFLLIPFIGKNHIFGVWALQERNRGEWTPDDILVLSTLGREAAMTIINLRIIEKLQIKIAEIEKAKQRLWATREDERSELARELHDGVIQDLIALRYRLETVQKEGDSVVHLSEIHSQMGVVADELRRLCSGLRPPALDQLGLAAALHALARELEENGLRIEAHCDDIQLPSDIAINLYRIAQEAISNAARYSTANRISLDLIQNDDQVSLIIEDDGHGFDIESAWEQTESVGLKVMTERTQVVGGTLEVISDPGKGTRIVASVRFP